MPQKSTVRVREFRRRQRANRPPKHPPKSGRERSREFRARKKALMAESIKASTSEIQVIGSTKKTNAQKCKEYRKRKKLEDVRVPNNSAQRSKEYRERQKINKRIELQQKNTDNPQSKWIIAPGEYMKEYRNITKLEDLRVPKNSAQRSKEYRQRQKISKQIELQQKKTDNLPSKSTLSPAEYMKEYRKRKKLEKLRVPNNSAQTPKEYRQRQKINKQIELQQQNTDNLQRNFPVSEATADSIPNSLVEGHLEQLELSTSDIHIKSEVPDEEEIPMQSYVSTANIKFEDPLRLNDVQIKFEEPDTGVTTLCMDKIPHVNDVAIKLENPLQFHGELLTEETSLQFCTDGSNVFIDKNLMEKEYNSCEICRAGFMNEEALFQHNLTHQNNLRRIAMLTTSNFLS